MELLSLSEYTKIAVKLLRKFTPLYMMSDENVGIVVNYLINSDLKYDPNKGQLKTYRYNGFVNALRKIRTFSKSQLLSLDETFSSGENRYSTVPDTTLEPSELVSNEESLEVQSHLVEQLLNNDQLTKTEQKYLKMMYVDGLSMLKVSEICGVSKQAVSYTELKALKKLRTLYASHCKSIHCELDS